MAEWIMRPITNGEKLKWSFQIIGELEEVEPFEQMAQDREEDGQTTSYWISD